MAEKSREKSPSILATEPFQLSDSDETCCNSPLFNDQLVSVSGTPIKLWKSPIFREGMKDFEESSDDDCIVVKVERPPAGCSKRVQRNLIHDFSEEDDLTCIVLDEDTDSEDDFPVSKRKKFDVEIETNVSSTLEPVYEVPPPSYFAEDILKILLNPKILKSKVCTRTPLYVNGSSTYVIDVTALRHPDDIKKDSFGVWTYNGSHSLNFYTEINDDGVKVEGCYPGAMGDNVYKLRCLRSVHPSNNDCRRLIALVTDSAGNPHQYALVVYYFPPGILPTALPHGNSKDSESPFYPTLPSTSQVIKSEAAKCKPKEAISRVSSKVESLLTVTSPGQLPRNERQMKHAKVSQSLSCNPVDELYAIMFEAKQQDASMSFIRDMKVLPEPAIILCSDYQLDDLVRFGCDDVDHCIVTVDPTFSLGSFEVTPITYRHLLLECRRSGKPLICLGPILIHYKKSFSTYLFFTSSLVGLHKNLRKLKAFGTDGEECLADAFSHDFASATHLTCQIHKRRNIEAKLKDMDFLHDQRIVILDDIFGKQVSGTQYMGLIDSEDEASFHSKLEVLHSKWSSIHDRGSDFYDWFLKYESNILLSTMLKPVREKAGLGSPPDIFTTNASESLNAVLKSKLNYKWSELPQFVKQMEELVIEQKEEFERAIINCGKFRIRDQYRHLAVSQDKWCQMSLASRTTHINSFHKLSLKSRSENASALSVSANAAASSSTVPLSLFEGIWSKALQLLLSKDSIAPAPGYPDGTKTVKSYSKQGFHVVLHGKGGKYSCDCPNYRSLNICSHTVAVAEKSQLLPQFIECYRKSKKLPSLTSLTAVNSRGSGRKGGKPPRKKRAKEAVTIRIPVTEDTCNASQDETNSVMNSIQGERKGVSNYGATATIADVDATTTCDNIPGPSYGFDTSPPWHYPPTPFQPPWTLNYSGEGGMTVISSPYQPSCSINNVTGSWQPTYVSHSTSSAQDSLLFSLKFIEGNVSVCFGCRNKYNKNAKEPHNICLQTSEWRAYTPHGSSVQQSRWGNTYYHVKSLCVRLKWPHFQPQLHVQIESSVLQRLSDTHKAYILSELGLQL